MNFKDFIILLLWSAWIHLHDLKFKKHDFSHAIQCSCTFFNPLPKALCFSSCLFKARLLKSQFCSDWSAGPVFCDVTTLTQSDAPESSWASVNSIYGNYGLGRKSPYNVFSLTAENKKMKCPRHNGCQHASRHGTPDRFNVNDIRCQLFMHVTSLPNLVLLHIGSFVSLWRLTHSLYTKWSNMSFFFLQQKHTVHTCFKQNDLRKWWLTFNFRMTCPLKGIVHSKIKICC